ncbi:MAG: ATP-dependent Clp protease adaptor ClpS [Ignavibacteria bacterium]|nr:ATP-dependent Clp protease adaptor ClpS [Ignavibacteria bacterium]
MAELEPFVIDKPELDVDVEISIEARVILFNDAEHSFDEVIEQLIKAVGCTQEQAEAMTFEVHVRGKAAVYEGQVTECLRVSTILEEIALHTRIEY